MEQKKLRTFAEVAREIKQSWKNMYFAARPYVDALSTINSSDKSELYMYDDAKTLVLYFLANASTWRGEDARRIKAELKSMIK